MVEKPTFKRSVVGPFVLGWKPLLRLVNRSPARVLLGLFLSSVTPAALLYGVPRQEPAAERNAETQRGEVTLRLGVAMSRVLDDGGVHLYQLTLHAGEYASVKLERRGTPLSLALSMPDSRKVGGTDSLFDSVARLSLIAGVAGVYQLEVRTEGEGGGYELTLDALRGATEQDKLRLSAEKLSSEAERLRGEWKAEQLRAALKKYEAARLLWKSVNDGPEEARALQSVGRIYSLLGENAEAVKSFEAALYVSQAAKDPRGEVDALNALGYAHLFFERRQEAVACLERALQLSRQINYRRGEAQALNNLGEERYDAGEIKDALKLFESALQTWINDGDRPSQAQTLRNLGYVYADLSDLHKSSDYLNRALACWRAAADLRGQAQTVNALGVVDSMLGENQKALESHNEAIQIFRALGDRDGEATALNGKAEVYDNMGEKQKSLYNYSRALELARAIGDRRGERVSLGHVGRIYNSMGQPQKALAFYTQALDLSRALGDRRMEAYWLKDIGDVHSAWGNKLLALDFYRRALAIARDINDLRSEAYALVSAGDAHVSLREPQKAIAYFYSPALNLSRAAEDYPGQILSLHGTARAERDLGRTDEARANLESALTLIESLRAKILSRQLRASYFASAHEIYELYIDLLMQMHKERPGERLDLVALYASERARARSFLEMLKEARADVSNRVSPALLERKLYLEQSLSMQVARQARVLGGKHKPEEAAAAARDVDEALAEYEELEAQIRAESPRYAALTQPRPQTHAQIQAEVLDADTVLLEYVLGAKRSYLWAVTPEVVQSFELPAGEEINSLARRVYGLLSVRPTAQGAAQYAEASAALSDTVLKPAAHLLGGKRLLVVSDGALQYVPFAVLPEPEVAGRGQERAAALHTDSEATPLVVKHDVVHLPSASVLALLREEMGGRAPAPGALAILADPVFDADDYRVSKTGGKQEPRVFSAKASEERMRGRGPFKASGSVRAARASRAAEAGMVRAARQVGLTGRGILPPLFFSRLEAETIYALVQPGEGMIALNFDASRTTATGAALSRYRIIHFATHALLDEEHPELSGLIFSLVDEKGRPQNGSLRLREIYNLNLPAELVVLSACQTALGKEVKGEGLIGLARGFMYAGAKGVLASLWQIDDRSTAELMQHFYRARLQENQSPAAALRAAQVTMWKQAEGSRRHPYYWGAFVLQGEWR